MVYTKNERGESGKLRVVNSEQETDAELHDSLKAQFANEQPISIWPTCDQLHLGASNAEFLEVFHKAWVRF